MTSDRLAVDRWPTRDLTASDEERKDEYSKQQRHYHRSRLPERIRKGVLDLGVPFSHLSDDIYHEVFQRADSDLLDGQETGQFDPHRPGWFFDPEDLPARVSSNSSRG